MFEKVVKGFDPIIDLVSAASYPLLIFMFIATGCMYMTGNEILAKKMAKNATIGYIIVQFAKPLAIMIHEATKGLSIAP